MANLSSEVYLHSIVLKTGISFACKSTLFKKFGKFTEKVLAELYWPDRHHHMGAHGRHSIHVGADVFC